MTRAENYNEVEDNNDVGYDTYEEKADDDHQEEAEYLLGDEGPTATEVS